MDELLELDKKLLLWLNGMHNDRLDPVMALVTKTWVWIPFYAILLWLLYKQYGKATLYILPGVAIAVTLADRITTGLMKPYFERLRPSHEPALQPMLHTVKHYLGGQYGFASSHAANVFAAAFLIWLLLRKYYRWSWLIFIWAGFISYTRIYLGVHYPGDILGGALVGILCGWTGYWVYVKLRERIEKEAVK